MDKNNVTIQSESENHVSFCDVMKNDTSEIIRKLESQVPPLAQNYSDLYAAYLQMFDNLFGTCYISEKEFFDKFNIDQKILRNIKKNSEIIKTIYVANIDRSAEFLDLLIKTRISAINSFDNYIHSMMNLYAESLSQLNKSMNQSK